MLAAGPERVPDHAKPPACCPGEASCGAPKYSEGGQPSFFLLHAASIERDMHSVEIDCILADDADDACFGAVTAHRWLLLSTVTAVTADAAVAAVAPVIFTVIENFILESILKFIFET
jgi:hypothetical protein